MLFSRSPCPTTNKLNEGRSTDEDTRFQCPVGASSRQKDIFICFRWGTTTTTQNLWSIRRVSPKWKFQWPQIYVLRYTNTNSSAEMATCISITNCWLLAFFLLSQKRCRRFGNLGWRRMEKRKGGRGISARRRHTASVRECENKDACLAHTLAADRTHPQLEKFSGKLWSFSKFKCHVKNSVFFLYFSTTTFKNL